MFWLDLICSWFSFGWLLDCCVLVCFCFSCCYSFVMFVLEVVVISVLRLLGLTCWCW